MMLGFFVSLWGTELLLQILSLLFTILWGTATCRTASIRCKQVFWPYLLVFTTLCRIGEATNPGPQSSFVLGAFNPSGLKGKAPYIVSQLSYGDIWAVSETHLCSQALHAFKTSLRFAKSPFGYCVGGCPVPSQQDRLFHSAWRGVAVLSKFPTREVPTVIPPAILSSSRLVVTTTLVNDVWITGGTIYGEPESSSYPHQKLNNEALLHHATAHVCHLAKGPRYLAGDWNQLQHTSPSFELMEAAGFRDLQDIACELWGRPIENTCKHATRKDFCYISRELQHLLLRVGMSHDVFPDHAVMWGEFSAIGNALPRQIWFSPSQFPWPADWEVDPNFWDAHTGDSDNRYHMLWQHIETQACRALPFPAPKNALGRAATTDVRPVLDGKVSPPKKARHGDIKPHYVCATFRHSQWLRQTRRIQAYVRHVRNRGAHSDHAKQLWGAIIRATGFSPSFAAWWEQCNAKVLGAPGTLPYVPPALDMAEKIFDSFAIAFRNFEQELHCASRAYARQKREMNPNAIFHDLQASKENGVALLIKPIMARVESVHSEHGELVLDREVTFDLHRPIFCNGQELDVAHAELDAMWVENVEKAPVGATVSQTRCRGTDAELFTLFLDAWKHMWERHRDVPASRWEPILSFARAKLVFPQLTWPAIDCDALIHSIAYLISRGMKSMFSDNSARVGTSDTFYGYGTVGTVGTVRWVRWVRYGGYGGYGTVGTVGTVRWVRWVRYGGYGGYGTVRAGTHPPYRTHRTVPPHPPYRTHCTHCTVPNVPTYRTHRTPYPPYRTVPTVPYPLRTHCTHRTVPPYPTYRTLHRTIIFEDRTPPQSITLEI